MKELEAADREFSHFAPLTIEIDEGLFQKLRVKHQEHDLCRSLAKLIKNDVGISNSPIIEADPGHVWHNGGTVEIMLALDPVLYSKFHEKYGTFEIEKQRLFELIEDHLLK